MKKEIIGIGPFIGDFRNEILNFMPYSRWLINSLNFEKVYLSTHLNRMFLYENFISKKNLIKVNESLSRDEKNQKGYVHKKIQKKEYRILLKEFKEKIAFLEKCNKKEIKIYNLNYIKSSPPCKIYNKIYNKINIPEINIPEKHKNRIIFIPSKNINKKEIKYVYNYLKKKYNCLLIGDFNSTYFKKENVIFQNVDYFENGFKYIIEYINNAKFIICPLSFWTLICNLQKKPLFSWGEGLGKYKKNGLYNFGNTRIKTVPSNTGNDLLIKSIDYFLKKNEI